MRRTITVIVALAAMTLGLATISYADDQHGRPSAVCAGVTEANHGSRDGADHRHNIDAAVPGSLVDSEGFVNVCRTNDAVVVEAAQGGASAKLMSRVLRSAVHPQLRHWVDGADADTVADHWVIVADGPSVNTGVNRTLTVVTPVVDTSTDAGRGWYQTNVRQLDRYSNNDLKFTVWQTPALWAGDGPVTLPIPS